MMGVTFGDRHSYHDMGLWLTKYPQITPPSPKTKYVDVPGSDGALDLSTVLTGTMQYERRAMTLEFAILADREAWPEIHSGILDALHGREMDIILDDDPEYCYTGRVSVSGYDPGKVTSAVTITADVEPYKTRIETTTKSFDVQESLTVTIQGKRKPVCPIITASDDMIMTFDGNAYALTSGENVLDDVILREGSNVFTITGSGSVSFAYREGRF